MKKKFLVCVIVIAVFSLFAASCTRSASGSPSDAAKSETEIPNPVSTQSQIMKDIIAGTQTAMAQPVDEDAEGDADEDSDLELADEDASDKDAEPEEEPTSAPLPTSTPGPAPKVELKYNSKTCAPGIYVCVQSFVKDQKVVLQATHPWLLNDMDLTFKMGLEGTYDYSEYIVVGTAKYEPSGNQGFEVELTIPDSLRGSSIIVVLLETNNSQYYGTDYFTNE
jgi:hypothetical protein